MSTLGLVNTNNISEMTHNTSIIRAFPSITVTVLNFCVIDPSSELIKFQTNTVINLTDKFSSLETLIGV